MLPTGHIVTSRQPQQIFAANGVAYVRERAISQNLWEKFLTTLEEASQQKRLSKDDVAILISDEETGFKRTVL